MRRLQVKSFSKTLQTFQLDMYKKMHTTNQKSNEKTIVDTRLEFISTELIIMQKIKNKKKYMNVVHGLYVCSHCINLKFFIASIYLIMIAECVAAVPSVLLFFIIHTQ